MASSVFLHSNIVVLLYMKKVVRLTLNRCDICLIIQNNLENKIELSLCLPLQKAFHETRAVSLFMLRVL